MRAFCPARGRILALAAALAAALVLAPCLVPPMPAAAQEAGPPAPPQTFDWAADREIPGTTPWGQPVDVESTRMILSWTTMPEYTNALVDHLPADAAVVSPTDHFGHPIGKPGVLHRVDEIYAYFDALAASSPRVRFQRLGETEEGNRLAVAMVGSEANLSRLDRVRRGLNALADPRTTSEAEASRLIAELPVVYNMTAGLHSTETGPPEMVMELAYRLAVSDDPVVREIRDEVVTFIVPVTEPDGRNRVVDWIRRYYPTPDTTVETTRPPYWGKYIYHDNNRDGLQQTARLTQIYTQLFLDWRFPIGHDLHESVPYLYTSTGTGPYNPTVDPITVSEWQWFANYEVTALTALGMPGVWTHGFYDGWNPTYLLWVTNTRNAMGRFYETFGNMLPWTRQRTLEERSTGVEWYRPNPPRDTTLWSLRNNTNYMQTGVLHALSLAAQNRERVLRQFWTKSKNSLRAGRTQAPHAYVVPADQARRADAAYMLDLLRRQGIEVHRATAAGGFDGGPGPGTPEPGSASDDGRVEVRRGDYVVRMDQPFRNFILTLMQVQRFPEDAPRPYDDVAWTFPIAFGVDVYEVSDPAILELGMEAADDAALRLPAELAGDGSPDWWLVRPHGSAFSIAARLALGDAPVWAAEAPLSLDGETVEPGAWLVRASESADARVRAIAAEHGFEVIGVDDAAVADVPRHEMDLPRVAILHTWTSTQAEGWVRYTFDRMGLPYTYYSTTELREARELKDRFDVIVFPDQRGDGKAILQGLDPELGPMPYRASDAYPALGFPDATADMTGGMGYEGLIALREFVDDGGTFITLRSATTLPVELGLVRGVGTEQPRDLFVPGSFVKAAVERPRHPVLYGYGDSLALHHRFGPYLTVDEDRERNVLVRYADADELFLSGLVKGGRELAGEPALLSVPSGRGHFVLFGFNPLNRHQNFMDFALVWNAIMHWNDLGVGLDGADDPAVAEEERARP